MERQVQWNTKTIRQESTDSYNGEGLMLLTKALCGKVLFEKIARIFTWTSNAQGNAPERCPTS